MSDTLNNSKELEIAQKGLETALMALEIEWNKPDNFLQNDEISDFIKQIKLLQKSISNYCSTSWLHP
jgi:hypothetical protein